MNFYSDRNTTYFSSRHALEFPALFNKEEPVVALSTRYFFSGLEKLGMKPKLLAEDTGFVLFTFDNKR